MKRNHSSEPSLSVRAVFLHAQDLPAGPEREAYLNQIAEGHPELVADVRSLLGTEVDNEAFLQENIVKKTLEETQDPDERVIDKYRILEKLGEGGFGEVYRVLQTQPIRRELALKLIKKGMDSQDVIARFESERQALALLNHPNIASIYDAGSTEDGLPFFVMELVVGEPITQYCDHRRFSIDDRLHLFKQVCAAIKHAHQKAIIHRDLKPSNIVVIEKDGVPMPKIIDFGIAKSLQGQLAGQTMLTQKQQLIGTPAYMSPEQLTMRSSDLDTKTDIYALGAVLYELLAGVTPFDDETLSKAPLPEVHRMLCEEEVLKPSTRVRTRVKKNTKVSKSRTSEPSTLERKLRGDLDWIVMKCLEKDRARRYESVKALASDLQAFLDGSPVSAAAPSTAYRIRKFVTRKRPAYAVWLEVSLAAVILLAATFYFRSSPLPVTPEQSTGGSPGLSSPNGLQVHLPEKSIAVLPFDNRSNREEDKHFTDGIHDDLLNQIARIQDIKTIARTSVMSYRDTVKRMSTIGEELNVRYLLEGGVQRSGDQIRINVQLINASTERTAWTDSYTRKMSTQNIFEIQSEIARSVASALKVILSPQEEQQLNKFPTDNVAAFEAYLLGKNRNRNERRGLEAAMQHFQKAIALDSGFAQAYVSLAFVEQMLPVAGGYSEEEQYAKASLNLKKALELDPTLGEAYYVLGLVRWRQRNFQNAVDACRKALELEPNHAKVYRLLGRITADRIGDVREAAPLFRKAYELDPLADDSHDNLSLSLRYSGKKKEALEGRERYARENPTSQKAIERLSVCYQGVWGRYDDAIEATRKYLSLRPTALQALGRLSDCYFRLGDTDSAVRWYQRQMAARKRVYARHRYSLAMLLGDNELKEQAIQDRIQEEPNSNYAVGHAMGLDLEQGRLAEARAKLETSFPEIMEPSFEVKAYNHRSAIQVARVLMQSGEEHQAKELLQKILNRLSRMEEWYFYKASECVIYALLEDEIRTLEAIGQYFELGGSPYELELDDRLKPYFDHPEYQVMAEKRKAELAVQLERVRTMEANEQLAPIPAHLRDR